MFITGEFLFIGAPIIPSAGFLADNREPYSVY
jgi:hypothetical protein